MSRIVKLIEQTAFLLEKQKEAHRDCAAMFADLLAVAQAKLERNSHDEEEKEGLEQIFALLSEQSSDLAEEAQADIDFLTEQLEALTNIGNIKDQARAQELLSMIIDEDEEIKDTEEFKREVTEEAVLSRQNLQTMLNDIKDAIQDGSAKEVALYLESILEPSEDEDGEDYDDEDEDEDHEEDGCCEDEEGEEAEHACTCGLGDKGGCGCKKKAPAKKSSGGGCGGCKGCGSGGGCGSGCGTGGSTDIFSSLKEYEKAILDDADEKTRH